MAELKAIATQIRRDIVRMVHDELMLQNGFYKRLVEMQELT